MNYKLIFRIVWRILMSPFITLWGIILLIAGTLFPLPLIVMFSFIGIIIELFNILLKIGGTKPFEFDSFMEISEYRILDHLIGVTIYAWAIPILVGSYIITGKIWNPE